jgi:hypothetical protein
MDFFSGSPRNDVGPVMENIPPILYVGFSVSDIADDGIIKDVRIKKDITIKIIHDLLFCFIARPPCF